MDQTKLKNISIITAGAAMIIGGLFYVLYSDLYLLNSSEWLFASIITSIGSAIAFLLCEGVRAKKVLFYILKALSVVLAIAFIFVLFKFKGSFDTFALVKSKGITTEVANARLMTVFTVSLVLGAISAVVELTNIVFNVIFGVDD